MPFSSIDSITLADSVFVFAEHSKEIITFIDQPRCFVLFSITNFNVQKILLSLSIHFAYFCRISAVEVIYLGLVHYFSVYACLLGCLGGGGGGGGCWCRHNSALLGKVYFKLLFTNYENILYIIRPSLQVVIPGYLVLNLPVNRRTFVFPTQSPMWGKHG